MPSLRIAGSKWFKQRKLLTPTFHFKILESFMQVFVEKSRELVDSLESKVDKNYFDVLPNITNTTLEVICGKTNVDNQGHINEIISISETAMGLPASSVTKNTVEYVQALREYVTVQFNQIFFYINYFL